MAKNKETEVQVEETEALAETPVENDALALSDQEMDDFYGEGAEETTMTLTFSHYPIVRESARFQVGDDEYEKTLVGHILHMHKSSQYFVGKYDASNPSPPVCFSIDGVKPSGGEDIQCTGICKQCKHDAYGTGTDAQGEATKGKACKNSMRFLFLVEGKMFPVTVTAPPTSLGKKGYLQSWLNSVPDEVKAAHDKIGKKKPNGGPITNMRWAKVELSLEKVATGGGEASLLKVKTLSVLVPKTSEHMSEIRQLATTRKESLAIYKDELETFIKGESDEAPAPEEEPPDFKELDDDTEIEV